ncbi:MAG TPA: DUF1080 domain-containing protein [Bacteroidetes bacterium]|nr:DUF1080 domain-containing protein [Bacteroidota bacterium]
MPRIFYPIFAILLFAACGGLKKTTVQESTAGYISLFNQKDLSGWTVHGREKWYVEDGDLICESGPYEEYSYLMSDSTFKDFDLQLEFKQEATGNSGVFIRSSIEGVKISGWQAEVAPPGGHTGGIYESYGRGWLIKPTAALDDVLKEGEWNKYRIRAVGDEVCTWLNGIRMVTLKDEKIGAATGQIGLQIHDGGGIKVRWRNIRIKVL